MLKNEKFANRIEHQKQKHKNTKTEQPIKKISKTAKPKIPMSPSEKMDLFDIKLRLGVLRSHSARDKSNVLNVYIFRILLTLAV